jgi:hypothetical protein
MHQNNATNKFKIHYSAQKRNDSLCTVDSSIIGSTVPQDKTLLAQKQGFLDIYH